MYKKKKKVKKNEKLEKIKSRLKEKLSLILSDRAFVYSLLIILLLVFINIDMFILSNNDLNNTYVSSYPFWYNVRYNRLIGEFLPTISIIIISIGCTYTVFKKMKSENINKLADIKKDILKSNIKAIFFLPFISIITFLVGSIVYKSKIYTTEYGIQSIMFPANATIHPFRYVILCTILSYIFSILIINLSIMIYKYRKNIVIAQIFVFVIFAALNYVLHTALYKFIYLISKKQIALNLIDGYQLNDISNIKGTFIYIIIITLLSYLVLYYIYNFKYVNSKIKQLLDSKGGKNG